MSVSLYERKVPGVRRRLISRASVVAFVDGPQNVVASGSPGWRPGRLVSLPAPAGDELVASATDHRPGVESRGGVPG